ncbi:MAG: MFS transporter [Bdellovibrionota bacterium]
MLMLKALKNRSIALLWGGQALSAIGDEIYRVALIWIAVGIIGPDTGYLTAMQFSAVVALSLVGGKWADRWDHFRTLIWVDLLRATVVLLPVVLSPFMAPTIPVLLVVALSLSSLSAFFDPALQAALPRYCSDLPTLRAATGLMATTMRLARVIGPGIVGLLTAVVPMVHFFTIDSLSYLISALSIAALRNHPVHRSPVLKAEKLDLWQSMVSGLKSIRSSPGLRYAMFAKALGGGLWNLAFSLGFALLARQISPGDVRIFGLLIGAYGIGNLSCALVLGNLPRRNPESILYKGYLWIGLGFLLMAVGPNLGLILAAAVFTGAGGPMNDLPFVDMIQSRFDIHELPKIFRLRIALETGSSLLFFLAAPTLFKAFGVATVIGGCGVGIIAVGMVGLALFSSSARSSSDA